MQGLEEKSRFWSLKRQFLDEKGIHPTEVLQGVIGVYSSHPSAPLSLHARVRSFTEQAFRQLDSERLAFRIPAMRLSVHMLPRATAHIAFSAAIPDASDPVWDKRYSHKDRHIPKEKYSEWRRNIEQLAAAPVTAKIIRKETSIPDTAVKPILNRMAFEGRLLRVGAESLRSNSISYVSTSAWTDGDFQRIDSGKAATWLAGEYLRAFGPVRVKDFRWWAGLKADEAKAAISAHATNPLDNDYLLPARDIEGFDTVRVADKDTLAILPPWDSYLMGYAPDGRGRFVSPDMQEHIYGSVGATGGNALGTLLINGLAHGTWKFRFSGSRMNVSLNMFEKPTGRLYAAIEERFNDIAVILGVKNAVLE